MSKIFNNLKFFFTGMPDNKDQILLKTEGKDKYLYAWY